MSKTDILKLIADNKPLLHKYGVKAIALFGSFVRGEQKRGSDIDLLVNFEKPTFDNYMGLMFNLEKLFGKKVDLVSVKALKSKIKPFILKEAKWVSAK